IEKAIANGHYDTVDYLIKNECPINKKNIIDRILVIRKKDRHFYGFIRNNEFMSISHLNRILDLGGTATIKSANMMSELGFFGAVIHLYKKLGIKPSKESILKFLLGYKNFYNNVNKSSSIIK